MRACEFPSWHEFADYLDTDAEHYAAKAREAKEIARRLRWWLIDARMAGRPGLPEA